MVAGDKHFEATLCVQPCLYISLRGCLPVNCRKSYESFSESKCPVLLLVCPTPVCMRMHKNDHVKDPVVHVRVRWITETQKDPAYTLLTEVKCTSVQ